MIAPSTTAMNKMATSTGFDIAANCSDTPRPPSERTELTAGADGGLAAGGVAAVPVAVPSFSGTLEDLGAVQVQLAHSAAD